MTSSNNRPSRRTFLKTATAAGAATALAGCALFETDEADEGIEGIPDDPFRIVHFTFESGPGAFYGEEAENVVEMMTDRINDRGGLIGEREVEIVDTIDEGAGVESMRTSIRNIAQGDDAEMLMGIISSANSLSVVPTADENEIPFMNTISGTYQLFEENPDLEYAVRTCATNASGAIGAARVIEQMDDVETVATIDQDYAWGHDHRDLLVSALERIRPDIEVLETRTPEPFISDYSAHVSALQDLEPDVVASSLWGGDLSTFAGQAVDGGMFDDVGTVVFEGDGGSGLLRSLGDDMPENVIMGGRGGYQSTFRYGADAAHREFVDEYLDRYDQVPGWGAYHEWVTFKILEAGIEKFTSATGNWPSGLQLMRTIRNIQVQTVHGTHPMTQAGGRQASAPAVFGRPVPYEDVDVGHDDPGHHVLTDYTFIPAHECNPPAGTETFDWADQIEPVE